MRPRQGPASHAEERHATEAADTSLAKPLTHMRLRTSVPPQLLTRRSPPVMRRPAPANHSHTHAWPRPGPTSLVEEDACQPVTPQPPARRLPSHSISCGRGQACQPHTPTRGHNWARPATPRRRRGPRVAGGRPSSSKHLQQPTDDHVEREGRTEGCFGMSAWPPGSQ